MRIHPDMKAALKKYFEIEKAMRQQESEGSDCVFDDIGWVDEGLFQQLGEAHDEFARMVSPNDYMSAFNEIAHLKVQIGELILENIALKSAVSRLGGDPAFIGNVSGDKGIQ